MQQTGRCGRDGQPSRCILYFNKAKEQQLLAHLDQVAAGRFRVSLEYAVNAGHSCLRRMFSQYFDGFGISCLENEQKCAECTGQPPLSSTVIHVDRRSDLLPIAEAASQVISNNRGKAEELRLAVVGLGRMACGFCSVHSKELVTHQSDYCPAATGMCIRCYRKGHTYAQCPLSRDRGFVPLPHCCRCHFPQEAYGINVHQGLFGKGCKNGWLVSAVIANWHQGEAKKTHRTMEDYWTWLHLSNTDFPQFLNFVVEFGRLVLPLTKFAK